MIFCLTKPRRLKRGFFYADNLILVNLTKNLICQVVRNAQCARLPSSRLKAQDITESHQIIFWLFNPQFFINFVRRIIMIIHVKPLAILVSALLSLNVTFANTPDSSQPTINQQQENTIGVQYALHNGKFYIKVNGLAFENVQDFLLNGEPITNKILELVTNQLATVLKENNAFTISFNLPKETNFSGMAFGIISGNQIYSSEMPAAVFAQDSIQTFDSVVSISDFNQIGNTRRAVVTTSNTNSIHSTTTNGIKDLFIQTANGNNVAIGKTASSAPLQAKLDVNGDINVEKFYEIRGIKVLDAINDTTSVGFSAGSVGAGNTLVGASAGSKVTTGSMANTFVGAYSGESTTSMGVANTFLGYSSGQGNTSGNSNTFVGESSGKLNTTGGMNSAFGKNAGGKSTTGASNLFLGANSRANNIGGSFNTFVGANAGINNTTGNNNVFIGAMSGANAPMNDNNKLYIEYIGKPLIFGDFITGQVGINTRTPKNKLDVTGNMAIGSSYAGTKTAPANGLIVEGQTLIGISTPPDNTNSHQLYVGGTGKALFKGKIDMDLADFVNEQPNVQADRSLIWAHYSQPQANNPALIEATTQGDQKFAVKSNGDTHIKGSVGIGTKTPKAKLDVAGMFLVSPAPLSMPGEGLHMFYTTPALTPVATVPSGEIGVRSGGGYQKLTITGNPLILNESGNNRNVGIGTTTPRVKLDVRADPSGSTNTTALWVSNDDAADWGYNTIFKVTRDNTKAIAVRKEKADEWNGSETFVLYGNGSVWASGSWRWSDKRWKNDIKPLQNTLDKVTKLQGVSYKWNKETRPANDDRMHIGFIAQEVEKVLPEMVSTDEKGYKAVSYDEMTAVLVEAVKELKAQNDALKAVICETNPTKPICQTK